MDLLATLRRSGGIDAVARQIGVPPPEVSAGVEALLPVILEDLRRHALRMGEGDSGIRALLATIEDLGGGQLAADVMGPGPLAPDNGERVLAQFTGPAEARDSIAEDMATVAGIEASVLARILPFLAMLVCGYIAARAAADALDGDAVPWLRQLLVIEGRDAPRAGSVG